MQIRTSTCCSYRICITARADHMRRILSDADGIILCNICWGSLRQAASRFPRAIWARREDKDDNRSLHSFNMTKRYSRRQALKTLGAVSATAALGLKAHAKEVRA